MTHYPLSTYFRAEHDICDECGVSDDYVEYAECTLCGWQGQLCDVCQYCLGCNDARYLDHR